jgi:hypothetical protein
MVYSEHACRNKATRPITMPPEEHSGDSGVTVPANNDIEYTGQEVHGGSSRDSSPTKSLAKFTQFGSYQDSGTRFFSSSFIFNVLQMETELHLPCLAFWMERTHGITTVLGSARQVYGGDLHAGASR